METVLSELVRLVDNYRKATSVEQASDAERMLGLICLRLDDVKRDITSDIMFSTAREMVFGDKTDPLVEAAAEIFSPHKAN